MSGFEDGLTTFRDDGETEMAVHEIDLQLPRVDVSGVDVKLVIHSDYGRLGRLRISKGSIDWYPKYAKTPRRLTWEQFADLMERRR